MDGHRFDNLTKTLARGVSRRRLLRGLGGGLLGAAAGVGEVGATPACRAAGHPCEGNQVCCDGLVCAVSGPGQATRCTAPSTTTTTTAAPTTTTTTTAAPTTTTTTTISPTTTTTTTTSTTTAMCLPNGATECTSDSQCCGGACCSGTCLDTSGDVINCGGCGQVCPGFQQPFDNVTCQSGACTFSCQGEHYDVDGDPATGCEVSDSPTGNHTQQMALNYGSVSCGDTPLQTVTGLLPSDARVHTNPGVTGFDSGSGSAPDWFHVFATGGFSCTNDLVATLSVSGSSALSCYKLTAITDQGTFSAQTNGSGVATISQGSGAYSDNTDLWFVVAKTCGTTVREAVPYTLSFHL